jgi:hypothetical protein
VTVALAERRGLLEVGANYAAHAALTHALYGDRAAALALARGTLSREEHGLATSDSLPRLRLLVVLGLLDAPVAARLVSELLERHPESTLTRGVVQPSARAAIELSRGRPAAALDELRAALPYETGSVAVLIPTFLRGEAYLQDGKGPLALEEFRKVLDNRGADPFSPVCALARLGAARALRVAGDRDKAAQAYREFFAEWKQADPGLPVLVEARAEYERLGPGAPSR